VVFKITLVRADKIAAVQITDLWRHLPRLCARCVMTPEARA